MTHQSTTRVNVCYYRVLLLPLVTALAANMQCSLAAYNRGPEHKLAVDDSSPMEGLQDPRSVQAASRRVLTELEGFSTSSSSSPHSASLLQTTSERARDYMDALLADPAAARSKLCGNFTKRSNVAVVFTCYERMEMIHKSLPAVLRSDGIKEFDVFISQDGVTSSIFDDETFSIPSNMAYVYIHHPVNLCTGLHMHFVKAFAFDIMGYDILLVVEEDNVIHPQGLQASSVPCVPGKAVRWQCSSLLLAPIADVCKCTS